MAVNSVTNAFAAYQNQLKKQGAAADARQEKADQKTAAQSRVQSARENDKAVATSRARDAEFVRAKQEADRVRQDQENRPRPVTNSQGQKTSQVIDVTA